MPGTAAQRERALEQFKLDEEEFHDRHEMLVSSLERGKIGFDEYLDRTIFYRPRPFAREVFKDYVFSLSQPHHEVLALAEQLAKSGKYFMATINNESKDLNLYRIQTFGLREIFSVFVSSCFVGLRKPEPRHLPPGPRSYPEVAARIAASSTIARSISNLRGNWECTPSRCRM